MLQPIPALKPGPEGQRLRDAEAIVANLKRQREDEQARAYRLVIDGMIAERRVEREVRERNLRDLAANSMRTPEQIESMVEKLRAELPLGEMCTPGWSSLPREADFKRLRLPVAKAKKEARS